MPPSKPKSPFDALFSADLDLDGDDEPEAPPQEAPGVRAVRGLLEELRASEQLVLVEPDVDLRPLAERLMTFLEKTEAAHVGAAVGDWLMRQDEIDELFAGDDDIEAGLRRHFMANRPK